MLTKEQQAVLDEIARRDGAYSVISTGRGYIYSTVDGTEILRDEVAEQPSEVEQLKARVAELEAALTRSR